MPVRPVCLIHSILKGYLYSLFFWKFEDESEKRRFCHFERGYS